MNVLWMASNVLLEASFLQFSQQQTIAVAIKMQARCFKLLSSTSLYQKWSTP